MGITVYRFITLLI